MPYYREPRTGYTEIFINNTCIIIIIIKRHEKYHWTKAEKNPGVQTKTHINPNQSSALTARLQSLGGFFPSFFLSGPVTFPSAGGTVSAAISHQLSD